MDPGNWQKVSFEELHVGLFNYESALLIRACTFLLAPWLI